MSHHPYSADTRTAVLATYRERGLAAAAREHGVGARTVTRWATAAGADCTAATKKGLAAAHAANELTAERLKADTLAAAVRLVGMLAADTPRPAGDLRALAVAAGILIDKVQLLTGAATERHEVRGLTLSAIDAEIARLEAQYRQ
jgi:transposase-like protein